MATTTLPSSRGRGATRGSRPRLLRSVRNREPPDSVMPTASENAVRTNRVPSDRMAGPDATEPTRACHCSVPSGPTCVSSATPPASTMRLAWSTTGGKSSPPRTARLHTCLGVSGSSSVSPVRSGLFLAIGAGPAGAPTTILAGTVDSIFSADASDDSNAKAQAAAAAVPSRRAEATRLGVSRLLVEKSGDIFRTHRPLLVAHGRPQGGIG